MERYDAGLLGSGGGGDVNWWQDYIRALLDQSHDHYMQEIERLEAVVDKLPKTVDGKPVTRGDKVYAILPATEVYSGAGWHWSTKVVVELVVDDFEWAKADAGPAMTFISDCYSTREVAEAVKAACDDKSYGEGR